MNTRVYLLAVISFFCMNLEIKTEKFSLFDGQHLGKSSRAIKKSGYWQLREGGEYQANNFESMIQVKASGVTIDFNNYSMINKAGSRLSVGIEVGFSQTELLQDSSLQQISNIVIKNGCFTNFDVGIIVHAGVNSITIENSTFDGVSSGIIFLGRCNQKKDAVIKGVVKGCTILGHGQDKASSLLRLRDYLERHVECDDTNNPLNLLAKTDLKLQEFNQYLCAYAGIIANYVHGLTIEDVYIQGIGYASYLNQSEKELPTLSFGIWCKNCAGVFISLSSVYCGASALKAVGMKFDGCPYVNIEDSDCLHHHSKQVVGGIEVTLGASDNEGLLYLNNVRSELHKIEEAPGCQNQLSTALCVIGPFSLEVKKSIFNENYSCKNVYGFYGSNIKKSRFENVTFNKNQSFSKDLDGSSSIGFFTESSQGLLFQSCHFSHNYSQHRGAGCCIKNSSNIEFKDCSFFDNQAEGYADVELMGSDTVGSIAYEQHRQKVSSYGPVVQAARTGGYGLIVQACHRISLLNSKSENNSGHRAAGFLFDSSCLINLQNCFAQYQYAYGNLLDDVIDFDKQSDSSIHISLLDMQKQFLFEPVYDSVDLKNVINYSQVAAKYLSLRKKLPTYWQKSAALPMSIERDFVRYISLLQGSLARYRMWGTAIGIHVHNCRILRLSSCDCIGQVSEKDSAIGCLVTGQSEDFYIQNSNFSYNTGWIESNAHLSQVNADYDYTCNISAVASLLNQVVQRYSKALSPQDQGFVQKGSSLIIQGGMDMYEDQEVVDVVVDKSKQRFVNIFAPTTAGLVFADSCSGGSLISNTMESNKGHAGYCYGLLAHKAENLLVQNNVIKDNASNIYGYCCGLMDINLYSANSYMQNYLSFNRVGGFFDSHSCIITEGREQESQVYPKTVLNNGKKERVASELDNVEVLFPTVIASDKKKVKK